MTICSICLDAISVLFGKRTKLRCGHKFHTECINNVFTNRKNRNCPNCDSYDFDKVSLSLLKCSDEEIVKKTINDHPELNYYEILKELSTRYPNEVLIKIILKVVDCTKYLIKFISKDNNIAMATRIANENPSINWHATSNGQTLIEMALSTRNTPLVNCVLDMTTAVNTSNNIQNDAFISSVIEDNTVTSSLYDSLYPSLSEFIRNRSLFNNASAPSSV